MSDDSPEALESMWRDQMSSDFDAEYGARLDKANAGGIDGVEALVSELMLESGILLGDAQTKLTLIEALSAKLGDEWMVANFRAMADVLQSWRDQGFKLVPEDVN